MFRTILFILATLAPVSLYAQTGDPITEFSTQDERMNAAMDTAKATLPRFLANMTDAEGYALPNTSVKAAFPTGNGAEIIWITPFVWDGSTEMAGVLANQPNFMGDLNAGDVVDFQVDMVRDWSLIGQDGTMWGNYTTRVMLPDLDSATATSLAARLADDPVPADWK